MLISHLKIKIEGSTSPFDLRMNRKEDAGHCLRQQHSIGHYHFFKKKRIYIYLKKERKREAFVLSL